MSDSKALTVSEADYEAIEAAVMETARGRWFLSEYARRNRTADTQILLDAIGRLESAVARERESAGMDRVRVDLLEMSQAIARTKTEIASIRPAEGSSTDLFVASEALDGIVRTTEAATGDILEAAEHVQEAAWTLREEGANPMMCDELDRRATDIYTACSFQDLTAQRTARIVDTLRFLEARLEAMIEIWGGGEASQQAAARQDLAHRLDEFSGLSQDGVDFVIIEDERGLDADEAAAARREALEVLDDGVSDADVVELDFPEIDLTGSSDAPRDPLDRGLPPDTIVEHDDVVFGEVVEEWIVGLPPESAELDDVAPLPDERPLVLEDAPLAAPRIGSFAQIDLLAPIERLRRFT